MTNAVIVLIALGGAAVFKVVDFIKFVLNSRNTSKAKNAAFTQLVVWGVGIGTTFVLAATTVAHGITWGHSTLANAGILMKLFAGVAIGSWASILADFRKAQIGSAVGLPMIGFRKSFIAGGTVLNPSPYDPTGGSTVPPGGSTPLGGSYFPGNPEANIPVVLQGTFVPGNVIAPGGQIPLQQTLAGGSVVAPGGTAVPGAPYVEPGVSPHVNVPVQGAWVPPGGTGGTAGGYTTTRPTTLGDIPVPPESPSEPPENTGKAVPAERARKSSGRPLTAKRGTPPGLTVSEGDEQPEGH